MISDANILNVHAGSPDRRDRIYTPSLRLLERACHPQPFADPAWLARVGKIKAYTQFHLTDKVERRDTCVSIYRHSLLYLVSNVFEQRRGVLILGMEKFFSALPPLTRERPERDWIASPVTSNAITKRSYSTTHGGFDNGADTRIAVIKRIARPQGDGIAAAEKRPGPSKKSKLTKAKNQQ
ncbi:MAG: peptidase [Chthoniobacteraceae bacterium]|nr:peptidase [Chthoniobacteraceae bacterium]